MSGIAKGIKKVFKAVGNFVKKVAAPVLAVAATVFTAGAALGLGPLAAAGGWGGAVASGLGAIGIPTTGVVGTALTSAVTQAGYGAAIGGIGSALTGGSFVKGAGMGALAGAVTGGLSGALNPAMPGAVTMSSRGMPSGLAPASSARPMPRPVGGAGITQVVPEGLATAGPAATGAATNGGAGIITGVTRGIGGLLDKPGMGSLAAGIGQGLMTGMAAKEEQEMVSEELDRRRESYEIDPSAYDQVAAASDRPGLGPRRWRFNESTNRVEYA